MIHYELDNIGIIESIIRSSKRYLSHEEGHYQFETAIMDFFRNTILKGVSSQEWTEALVQLKEQVIEIQKDEYEAEMLMDFDFISWCDSKIENRSFIDVVREKANKSPN